jgi:hypothetical protein
VSAEGDAGDGVKTLFEQEVRRSGENLFLNDEMQTRRRDGATGRRGDDAFFEHDGTMDIYITRRSEELEDPTKIPRPPITGPRAH